MKTYLFCIIFLVSKLSYVHAQPCNGSPFFGDSQETSFVNCNLKDIEELCVQVPIPIKLIPPQYYCDSIDVANHTMWSGFLIGGYTLSININISECLPGKKGIKALLLKDTINQPIECIDYSTDNYNTSFNFISNKVNPDCIYWLVLKDADSSNCKISFEIIEGSKPFMNEISSITGPQKICRGDTTIFNIDKVKGALEYIWTVTPHNNTWGTSRFTPSYISVFDSSGIYPVCINIYNTCLPPKIKCIDVTVENPIVGINPDAIKICSNQTYLYNGTEYQPGQYEVHFPIINSCDSIVTLTIEGINEVIFEAGCYYNCKEDCIEFKDNYGTTLTYCDAIENGIAKLKTYGGCDSLVSFSIKKIDVQAYISNPKSLSCYDTITEITGFIVANNVVKKSAKWLNEAGNQISDSLKITVAEPGKYCLVVNGESDNGLSCSDTSCVEVKVGNANLGLELNISDVVINCGEDSVCLDLFNNNSGVDFHWEGPNGFEAPGKSICVDKAGNYQLIAIAFEGCSDTLSIDVSSDYDHKSSFKSEVVLCLGDSILINNNQLKAPNNYSYNVLSNDTCYLYSYELKLKNAIDKLYHICPGETIQIGDSILSYQGTYYIPIVTQTNCDSVYVVKVVEDPIDNTTVDLLLASGSNYNGIVILKDTIITSLYKNQYGCDSTVIANIKVTTGTIETLNEFEIFVVPNPAKDNCTIIINPYNKYITLELRTITGSLVKQFNILKGSQQISIDLSSLADGLYIIGFHDGNKVLGVKKLSVLHH